VFTSDDSSDWTGAGWSYNANGSAERLGSGGDIAVSTATFGDAGLRFRAFFNAPAANSVNRVYVRYGASSYLYGEAIVQSLGTTIRIAVGTDSGELINNTVAFAGISNGFSLELCYETGALTIVMDDESTPATLTSLGVADTGNTSVAFGCDEEGVVVGEQVVIKTQQSQAECPPCDSEECGNCDTGTTQNAYGVIVSGAVNGECNAGCDALDGTYVMWRRSACLWQYGDVGDLILSCTCGAATCTITSIGMEVTTNFGQAQITLTFTQTALPTTFSEAGLDTDCDFDAVDLTNASNAPNEPCDLTSATCEIIRAA